MTEIIQATGLINEPFIALYPSAAKYLGINKAVIIQQIHFLLNAARINEEDDGDKAYHLADGEWWIYNSFEKWQAKYFPWISLRTVKTLFADLEKDGLIKSRMMTGRGTKRTKWYTIDYTQWEQFALSIAKAPKHQSATAALSDTPQSATAALSHAHTKNHLSKRKDSAPKKGAGNGTRKRDLWYDAVEQIWDYSGALNKVLCQMLQGKATQKGYKECNLTIELSPDEVIKWAAWYRATELRGDASLTMVQSPAKIQSSLNSWDKQGRPDGTQNDPYEEMFRGLKLVVAGEK